MGDLSQEPPESPKFPQAMDEALQQIHEIGLELHHCAGNHDVGDKPDPSMPTHPVTSESLDAYHNRLGKSWYSFDHGDHHLVVINSQILNTDLDAAASQKTWLESDLANASNRRIALFLHLPPYLLDRTEPAFGNYDVIGEPARSWLLELVDRHQIELMCSAHVHFAFFDRLRHTDYFILPSPAFTRPGFSNLFTSGPPPEHGRDDTPKLGFYLFRSGPSFLDTHIIRTLGKTDFGPGSRLITRTARSLPNARLGMTLTHTPAPIGQVPLAYPSIVRQTVRNDYPLLTCQEMGLRHLRVTIADILNSQQNERLQILRKKGTSLTGICVTRSLLEAAEVLGEVSGRIDAFELQVAKADLPGMTGGIESDIDIAIAAVDPTERVPGKQHLRIRVGFTVSGATFDHPFDRTVISIAAWEDPYEIDHLIEHPCGKPIDVILDLTEDDSENATRVAKAALLTACLSEARLFCQPYLDLDRTMDVAHGFLDTLCNPRPVVTVYRLLNTLLFSRDETWTLTSTNPLTIRSAERELTLTDTPLPETACRMYDLIEGTSYPSASKVDLQLGLRDFPL